LRRPWRPSNQRMQNSANSLTASTNEAPKMIKLSAARRHRILEKLANWAGARANPGQAVHSDVRAENRAATAPSKPGLLSKIRSAWNSGSFGVGGRGLRGQPTGMPLLGVKPSPAAASDGWRTAQGMPSRTAPPRPARNPGAVSWGNPFGVQPANQSQPRPTQSMVTTR